MKVVYKGSMDGIDRYEGYKVQYFIGGNEELLSLYRTYCDEAEWWGVYPEDRKEPVLKPGTSYGIKVDYTECVFKVMELGEIEDEIK